MVNFHDPVVIEQDLLVVKYIWHTLAGLYFWEFFTTLDYEWDVIRGRRPYRWTIAIYSVTRLATLLAVIISLFGLDSTKRYNCEVRLHIQFFFGYLAFVSASLLIVLRIIAIWNRKKLVIAMATGVWVTNLGFQLQSLVRLRAEWVPAMSTCAISNVHTTKLNLIPMLIADTALLLIMLIGLLRLGFHESGVFGLGRLMWRQGLVWLFIATIAEVPPVVFISLDLNDPLSYAFNFPAMITISIAATRIYRSLVDFLMDVYHSEHSRTDGPHSIAFKTSKTNRVPAQSITLDTVEVTTHKTYTQYQMSQTSRDVSPISGEGSLRDKPAGLGLDYDVERGVES